MELDAEKKKLLRELGQAINTAVSESAHVASVVSRIRGAGLDVVLSIEGTVNLSSWLEQASVTQGGFLRTLHLTCKFADESATRTDSGLAFSTLNDENAGPGNVLPQNGV